MQEAQFVGMLKDFVERFEQQKHAAKEIGVTPQYLNDVLKLRQRPNDKMLKYFKLKWVIGAVPAPVLKSTNKSKKK